MQGRLEEIEAKVITNKVPEDCMKDYVDLLNMIYGLQDRLEEEQIQNGALREQVGF